jgi:hypothetical protein
MAKSGSLPARRAANPSRKVFREGDWASFTEDNGKKTLYVVMSSPDSAGAVQVWGHKEPPYHGKRTRIYTQYLTPASPPHRVFRPDDWASFTEDNGEKTLYRILHFTNQETGTVQVQGHNEPHYVQPRRVLSSDTLTPAASPWRR